MAAVRRYIKRKKYLTIHNILCDDHLLLKTYAASGIFEIKNSACMTKGKHALRQAGIMYCQAHWSNYNVHVIPL